MTNQADDVSRRDKQRRQRRALKMEALGTLAGGIAHDFNNILQAIMGFTALARAAAPSEGSIRADLDRVESAAMRGGDLVKRILLFSRQETHEREVFALAGVVQTAAELLRSSLPSTIELQVDIDPDCGSILGDKSQISQIVMNLGANAFLAMEGSTGIVTITLNRVASNPLAEPRGLASPSDGFLHLAIQDTGSGMTEATLEHVFEPFYSTREVGEGSGLGLSVVHGIVVGHNGDIEVKSELGLGTRIDIYLPRRRHAIPERPAASAVRQLRQLLFVDDEAEICNMVAAYLERRGIQVTTHSNAHDAIAAIRENPQIWDLVVSDYTMPGMTGDQLAGSVHKIRPDLPIILVTGAGDATARNLDSNPNILGTITKPFALETLEPTIRQLITAASLTDR